MQNNAFQPFGPTVLIDENSAYIVPSAPTPQKPTSYRIRNITSTAAYVGWAAQNFDPTTGPAAAPAISTPAAKSAGVANPNVIGMVASSVEVFVLPSNCYFKASSGATFEVTPGEGI